MEFFFIWIVLAALVGLYASKQGRSGFGGFLVGLVVSPLIGFIVYLVLGESPNKSRDRIMEEERIRAEARKRYNG